MKKKAASSVGGAEQGPPVKLPSESKVRKLAFSLQLDLWEESLRLQTAKMFPTYSAYISDLIRRDILESRPSTPPKLVPSFPPSKVAKPQFGTHGPRLEQSDPDPDQEVTT